MSKKPENVKCENCVFWERWTEDDGSAENKLLVPEHWRGLGCVGQCRGRPGTPDSAGNAMHLIVFGKHHWCGAFRSEWPEEVR
jgi:hypothetical protein